MQATQLAREDAESGLTFAGFLVLQCPMKAESAGTISELVNSSHQVSWLSRCGLSLSLSLPLACFPRRLCCGRLRACPFPRCVFLVSAAPWTLVTAIFAQVVMITGDHTLTACHVAAELKITTRPVLVLNTINGTHCPMRSIPEPWPFSRLSGQISVSVFLTWDQAAPLSAGRASTARALAISI